MQKIKQLLCFNLSSLPSSIHRAQSLARHAAHHHFSWPNAAAVIKKIKEEMKETEEAVSALHRQPHSKKHRAHVAEEIGDILFTTICLAESLGIAAPQSLAAANRKFQRRFTAMTRLIKQEGRDITTLTPRQLEHYWQRIKSR